MTHAPLCASTRASSSFLFPLFIFFRFSTLAPLISIMCCVINYGWILEFAFFFPSRFALVWFVSSFSLGQSVAIWSAPIPSPILLPTSLRPPQIALPFPALNRGFALTPPRVSRLRLHNPLHFLTPLSYSFQIFSPLKTSTSLTAFLLILPLFVCSPGYYNAHIDQSTIITIHTNLILRLVVTSLLSVFFSAFYTFLVLVHHGVPSPSFFL